VSGDAAPVPAPALHSDRQPGMVSTNVSTAGQASGRPRASAWTVPPMPTTWSLPACCCVVLASGRFGTKKVDQVAGAWLAELGDRAAGQLFAHGVGCSAGRPEGVVGSAQQQHRPTDPGDGNVGQLVDGCVLLEIRERAAHHGLKRRRATGHGIAHVGPTRPRAKA
jgi:hypothetical protein